MKYPACSIGLLQVEYSYGTVKLATGFLIYKNIIMTSASNCYDCFLKKYPEKITFYPKKYHD